MQEASDVSGLSQLVSLLHQRFDRLASETTETGRKVTVIETTLLAIKDELKPDGQHSAMTRIALNEQRITQIMVRCDDIEGRHGKLEERHEAKENEERSWKRSVWLAMFIAVIGFVGAVVANLVMLLK